MPNYVKAALYYIMVLGASIGLALFQAPAIGGYSLMIVMLTPLVSVLIMKLLITREGWTKGGWADLGLKRLGVREWPVAIVLPFLILLFAFGVVWTFGIGRFVAPEGLVASVPDMLISLGMGIALSLGEEIGWRGYLLPKLMPLGHRQALLLSGLMQAIWHVPFIVFTGLYHGDGNAWIVVPMFLLTMTLAEYLFGYLRIVGKSTWPAVIAHGVFNWWWNLFMAFTLATSPLAFEYLAGESGLLTIAAVALSAFVLIRRMENPARGLPPAV